MSLTALMTQDRSLSGCVRLLVPRLQRERQQTFRSLNLAQQYAFRIPTLNLQKDRYIILSDLHKGDGLSNADDFIHNHEVYNHALEYYLGQDYRLVLNGDIEENWKTRPSAIVDAYADTVYALEREFIKQSPQHYLRIWGNHDTEWADPAQVKAHLQPILKHPIQVHSGVMLGEHIFIVHGHQGDPRSDQYAWVSRPFVRHGWRHLQNLFKLSLNHHASNSLHFFDRERHLHHWAKANRKLMIAGHTHRPMFRTWPLGHGPSAPHYLNSGACTHTNGITGIEIDRGEIRLIRWHQNARRFVRSTFMSNDLGALLARL